MQAQSGTEGVNQNLNTKNVVCKLCSPFNLCSIRFDGRVWQGTEMSVQTLFLNFFSSECSVDRSPMLIEDGTMLTYQHELSKSQYLRKFPIRKH